MQESARVSVLFIFTFTTRYFRRLFQTRRFLYFFLTNRPRRSRPLQNLPDRFECSPVLITIIVAERLRPCGLSHVKNRYFLALIRLGPRVQLVLLVRNPG